MLHKEKIKVIRTAGFISEALVNSCHLFWDYSILYPLFSKFRTYTILSQNYAGSSQTSYKITIIKKVCNTGQGEAQHEI
jgi:hypothetical protein